MTGTAQSSATRVSVRRMEKYHPESLLRAVAEIYEATRGPDPCGKKILLKPNILADVAPERAVTTHPQVFRAVARYLQQRGAVLLAGDSPAIHNNTFSGKGSGIAAVCEELGIEWVDFMRDPLTKKGYKLARILNEVDYVFSLPKCKTHEFAYYTGAVKNLFGLMPGFNKALMHAKYPNRESFAEMIIDVFELVGADYAFMDAVIGMEGAGPQNGTPRHIGLLLGSRDCLALDVIMAQIIGYDSQQIPVLSSGLKRRPDLSNINDIEIEGGTLKDFRVRQYKRIAIDRGYNFIYMGVRFQRLLRRFDRRPVFIYDRCILCKKCVQICRADALKVKDGKIAIYDPNCIRCYCCHEVCPVNAIKIRRKVF